jgi:hypothetical protein
MDLAPVIEALQATLVPQLRKTAEEQLAQVRSNDTFDQMFDVGYSSFFFIKFCKTPGFISCLIQIILSEQCDMGARQAGISTIAIVTMLQ